MLVSSQLISICVVAQQMRKPMRVHLRSFCPMQAHERRFFFSQGYHDFFQEIEFNEMH